MLAMSSPCFSNILGDAEFSDSVLHFPSFLDEQEMLAMSSPCFSNILGDAEFSDSVLHFPSFLDEQEITYGAGEETTTSSSPQFSMVKDDDQLKGVKKINHNANERDRRRKINGLYKSLRDLLPQPDQQKKLSIPTTVSRVVQYIPELEKEVESLIQKKEKILNMISQAEQNTCQLQNKMKTCSNNFSPANITATQLNDKEIMVQVLIMESSRASFAQALFNLEQDGLLLLNSSVFRSSDARVFYNLHLQVEATTQALELEGLKQKLFALFENHQHLPLLPIFSSNNYMESIY